VLGGALEFSRGTYQKHINTYMYIYLLLYIQCTYICYYTYNIHMFVITLASMVEGGVVLQCDQMCTGEPENLVVAQF
jgi:general stress protein CsbA